jgi:nucleoside 2-deoxyribosyltransferase
MKRIYLAGPYSSNNVIKVFENMKNGMRMATKLLLLGYAVFCPWWDYHAFLELREEEEIPLEVIQKHSMMWLEVSDAILVLPDHHQSKGTLAEIARAKELNIPIYFSLKELINDSKLTNN